MRRLVSLTLVLLAACSMKKVTVSPTNPPQRPLPSRVMAQVEVFTSHAPERPFIEIAVLTANYGDPEEDIQQIRAKAGEYGCDAVVFSRLGGKEEMYGHASSRSPVSLAATCTASP